MGNTLTKIQEYGSPHLTAGWQTEVPGSLSFNSKLSEREQRLRLLDLLIIQKIEETGFYVKFPKLYTLASYSNKQTNKQTNPSMSQKYLVYGQPLLPAETSTLRKMPVLPGTPHFTALSDAALTSTSRQDAPPPSVKTS